MTSPHHQELLDFQMNDSNFMKMIQMADSLSRKLKTAQASVVLAREAFERFKKSITPIQQTSWSKQEEAALLCHIHDPSVMDVFEIQLKKGITVILSHKGLIIFTRPPKLRRCMQLNFIYWKSQLNRGGFTMAPRVGLHAV
ncbi:hypothetical protein PISMIDRAFT_20404 [Pisolithus microcarpus 441]|uniref:Uncharacterized protein n=1 Tax=Pisolithus microcarpus 441 TaxID=765257 RepID=A0A0C9Y8U3_9AGAM|nr:hypothetical protein PISMIDRAFT_20404 [Pisolithus microcarpus 441]